jgi:ubiquinone/menaquinone biosynthesis C-methylase UbiE
VSEQHGLLIRGARRYDLKLWLRSRGRIGSFRTEVLDLAGVEPGDRVLDIGCGTGGLALAAKRRVGESGVTHGIDPSEEMIAAARAKARRARLDVRFDVGVAQELPLTDASVDRVVSTLMLHHLSHDALMGTLREVQRVLVPEGRFLGVDIDLSDPSNPRHGPHAHAHAAGARFDLDAIAAAAAHLGLEVVDSGPVAFRLARFERMRYLLLASAAHRSSSTILPSPSSVS